MTNVNLRNTPNRESTSATIGFLRLRNDIFLIFQQHKHLSEPGATHGVTLTSNSFY